MKQQIQLIVHDDPFHLDDLLCVSLLRAFSQNPVYVKRTRDLTTINASMSTIVCDVGGKLDGQDTSYEELILNKKIINLDHHQHPDLPCSCKLLFDWLYINKLVTYQQYQFLYPLIELVSIGDTRGQHMVYPRQLRYFSFHKLLYLLDYERAQEIVDLWLRDILVNIKVGYDIEIQWGYVNWNPRLYVIPAVWFGTVKLPPSDFVPHGYYFVYDDNEFRIMQRFPVDETHMITKEVALLASEYLKNIQPKYIPFPTYHASFFAVGKLLTEKQAKEELKRRADDGQSKYT